MRKTVFSASALVIASAAMSWAQEAAIDLLHKPESDIRAEAVARFIFEIEAHLADLREAASIPVREIAEAK